MKNALVKNEEILKRLQKSHPHLAHFSEKQILNYFHVQSLHEFDGHIKQLKESQAPYNLPLQNNEICSCRDGQGQIKELYDSEVSAREQIGHLAKEKRSQLRVYRCPYGSGWHLTKG